MASAASSAATLAAIDVVYVTTWRISPSYVADAAVQVAGGISAQAVRAEAAFEAHSCG